MRRKEIKKYERESFEARLQMERESQNNVSARLKAIELQLKNQGRI